MKTMWKSASCWCQPVPFSGASLAFTSCAMHPPAGGGGDAEVAVEEEIAQPVAHPGRLARLDVREFTDKRCCRASGIASPFCRSRAAFRLSPPASHPAVCAGRMLQCSVTRSARQRGATGFSARYQEEPCPCRSGNLPDTRYPDPRIERLDPRFIYKQGNAAIERIATGFRWAEGPVYFRDGGFLLFSDIPNNRMMRWLEEDGHLSVFRAPSQLRQRQYARSRGAADHLRARHAARHAHRTGRHASPC